MPGGGVCGRESLATSAASGGLPDARSPCRTAPPLTPPWPLQLPATCPLTRLLPAPQVVSVVRRSALPPRM